MVGLASDPTPTVFKDVKLDGATLHVWYADDPRIHDEKAVGKSTGVRTSAPEEYLKVEHVTIEAPPGIEVTFSSRFVSR